MTATCRSSRRAAALVWLAALLSAGLLLGIGHAGGVTPHTSQVPKCATTLGAKSRVCIGHRSCPKNRVGARSARGLRCTRVKPRCAKGARRDPTTSRCVVATVGSTAGAPIGAAGTTVISESPATIRTPLVPDYVGPSMPAEGLAPSNPKVLPLSGGRILWGAWITGRAYARGGAPFDMQSVSEFERNTKKGVSIIHWGQPWFIDGAAARFPTVAMNAVRSHGSIPLMDWGSWDVGNRSLSNQPAFSLREIAAGRHDAYLREFATAVKAWGHPLMISLDPEMNGRWPLWSEQNNANRPGDFRAMWRHVHSVFDSVGAANVTWVWQVNTKYSGSTPISVLYPGDDMVDWVGISGYGWGTHPAKNYGWHTFETLFAPISIDIAEVAPGKPVMICETGASEYGGSKAGWITDALTVRLPTRFPSIRGFVWFNAFDAPYDWQIESSQSAQDAFAAGIGLPIYASNTFGSL